MADVEEIPCNSAEEFWDKLSPLKPLFPEPCKLLYRGQSNAEWGLVPTLLRSDGFFSKNRIFPFSGSDNSDSIIFEELRLLRKFVEYCDTCALQIPNDSKFFRDTSLSYDHPPSFDRFIIRPWLWPNDELFELMVIAQHHGLPTRLLDWSKRSYVSAFFAASDSLRRRSKWENPKIERMAVWVLDIEGINRYNGYPQGKEIEILTVPSGPNKNMAAQQGVLSVLRQRAERHEPFIGTPCLYEFFTDKTIPSPLKKITVPLWEADKILNLCEAFGINNATLFPDYAGAANAAMDDFRIGKLMNEKIAKHS